MTAQILIIGTPGFAIAGPNAVFGSSVVASGGVTPPVLVQYDFSEFMDGPTGEYIASLVSPGGSVVMSSRTGRALSQVDVTANVYPTGGSCTINTSFDRSLTLSF